MELRKNIMHLRHLKTINRVKMTVFKNTLQNLTNDTLITQDLLGSQPNQPTCLQKRSK